MIAHSSERVVGLENFSSADVEQQYGVLPWRKGKHGNVQVLLITSRTRGRWIVPKGWPIRHRAPYLSAALEAFEEAGVIGEVQSHPLASYHYVKEGDDGGTHHRRVTLFSLRVVGTLTNWPERGQRKRRWFDLAEAADTVDDAELGRIVRAIQRDPQLLMKKEGRVPDNAGRLEAGLTT